jgi:hypothetical protein
MVENKEYRVSTIDPDWKIYTFNSTDEVYPSLLFELYGIAFADLSSKIIVIDGEQTSDLTPDHILAVEAHEISHSRLNHANRQIDQITQEKEADWLAHRILISMNLVTPARLLSERYMLYYSENITSLDDYMCLVLADLSLE